MSRPESIADRLAWVETIEPLGLIEEERESFDRFREEFRRRNLKETDDRSSKNRREPS